MIDEQCQDEYMGLSWVLYECDAWWDALITGEWSWQ